MLPIIVFLAVVGGLVLRKMTAEERIQLGRRILQLFGRSATTAFHAVRQKPSGCDDFYEALRARTRWTMVTPSIVAVGVTVHFLVLWSGGGSSEGQLLEWGASVGPRTTNGGWWRLGAAMFLHWSWLHLIADSVGLVIIGALIERVVGRSAFALVYLASGLIAGVWSLAAHPVSVMAGAAGAVFGVYGLLAATMIWGFWQRSPLTIPRSALKRAVPGAVVFLVYHLATEGFGSEALRAGLLTGFVGGLILAARVSMAKPPLGRVCATCVATFALLITFAAPLRGIADVPAEVARVIDVEKRTAAVYDAETEQFKRGRISADELAAVADTIGAEVQTVRAAVAALKNVPPEHRPLRQQASEYLRLREDSWHLRVVGLRKGRLQTLQDASVKEVEAMRAFERVEALSLP